MNDLAPGKLDVPALLFSGRFSSTIQHNHADELRVYFRHSGYGIFERSTFGSSLDRAEMYSRPARPCVTCGGDMRADRPGTGFVPTEWVKVIQARKAKRKTPLQSHHLEVAMVEFSERHPGEHFDCTEVCDTCGGTGWVPGKWPVSGAQTARPTGSSMRGEGGVRVSDTAMHALAVVSSRLAGAVKLFPICEEVLEAYYGPDSGGILNIWPLTQAGKKLLKKNSVDLDSLRFLANERADQEQKQDNNRRKLFEAADNQAKELLDIAGRSWNAAVELLRRPTL